MMPGHELVLACGVLGLRPPVDRDAIVAAYRQRVRYFHPDRGGDASDFRAATAAREILLEAVERCGALTADVLTPRPDVAPRAARPHWRRSQKGNPWARTPGGTTVTVFQTRSGRWSWVCDGAFAPCGFDTEAEAMVDAAEEWWP